jgi:hypothetical protein
VTVHVAAEVVSDLARGVAARVRAMTVALDRLSALDETRGPQHMPTPGEAEAAARQVLRKALQAAADPCTYGMLRAACETEGLTLEAAAQQIGCGRLAAMDRLYDLVQAGLLSGSVGLETLVPTDAGQALVRLVEGCAEEVVALSGVEV